MRHFHLKNQQESLNRQTEIPAWKSEIMKLFESTLADKSKRQFTFGKSSSSNFTDYCFGKILKRSIATKNTEKVLIFLYMISLTQKCKKWSNACKNYGIMFSQIIARFFNRKHQ